MKESLIKDVLSWDQFFKESAKANTYPPKKIELFNRLIAYTDNFFAIAAIGAFTPGYLMIIAKKLIPSFSFLENKQIEELKWLIEKLSKAMKNTYGRDVVFFEHGMCACVGGLDRAHLHLMTIDKSAGDKLVKDCINSVLISRRAGIKSVEVSGHKLENIHDISEIMNSSEADSYKVNGKQLIYEDICNDLDINNWPTSTIPHVKKGGHYVYFQTNSLSSSFLTNKNFHTQLGRQIVFEIEIKTNDIIKNMSEQILKKNNYANIWKWQEFAFKENMLKTMNDLIPSLSEIVNDSKNNKFNFKTLKKNN